MVFMMRQKEKKSKVRQPVLISDFLAATYAGTRARFEASHTPRRLDQHSRGIHPGPAPAVWHNTKRRTTEAAATEPQHSQPDFPSRCAPHATDRAAPCAASQSASSTSIRTLDLSACPDTVARRNPPSCHDAAAPGAPR